MNLTFPEFLSSRQRSLAPDANIEQNLAAMLFNVDVKFALEILLDERISAASTLSESETLIELYKSKGFDLRVAFVIQIHASGWISAGDFGQVIQNYSALAEVYSGDAKTQISDSLLQAFGSIRKLDLNKKIYTPYFGLLQLCNPSHLSHFTSEFVSKLQLGMKNIEQGELSFSHGQKWVEFLLELQRHLTDTNNNDVFDQVLSKISLPSNSDFVLGLAHSSHIHNIPLSKYDNVAMALLEDETQLEDFAKEEYDLSNGAFTQLNEVNAISDSAWIKVGNFLIQELLESEFDHAEICRGNLETLASVWSFVKIDKRSNITVNELFEDISFYEGIHANFGESDLDIGVVQAIFLARQLYLSEDLPQTLDHENGTITESGNLAYKWFKSYFNGDSELDNEHIEMLARQVIDSPDVTRWLAAGRDQSNPLTNSILISVFGFEVLPNVPLPTLLESFAYLKDILDNDLVDMLAKYENRFGNKDLENLTLDQIPVGLLEPTSEFKNGNWEKLHEKTRALVESLPPESWDEKLVGAKHELLLLIETAKCSNIEISSSEFRDAYLNFVLSVLRGRIQISNKDLSYDVVFSVIPKTYHQEIFRQTREKVSDVTADGLKLASEILPKFLKDAISVGEKIHADEKDNVVRHILCKALESNNSRVLLGFVELGYTKIANFKKASQVSTLELLNGSLETFAKSVGDRDFSEKVSNAVIGKRKTKTFLNIFFPLMFTDDTDEFDDAN